MVDGRLELTDVNIVTTVSAFTHDDINDNNEFWKSYLDANGRIWCLARWFPQLFSEISK